MPQKYIAYKSRNLQMRQRDKIVRRKVETVFY